MYKVIDIVYHYHSDIDTHEQVLSKHYPSTRFVNHIQSHLQVQFVKHLNYQGLLKKGGVQFAFFKSKNRFWYIPFATHRYIKKQQPDIVIIEGLIFPLQLLFLTLYLGRRSKIIVQHHGEKPFNGIRRLIQKMADYFIDVYLFTALGNAKEWIEKGTISNYNKCREVLEASTDFEKKDKEESRSTLTLQPGLLFLWVGRLDRNKDPVTVLKAFETFLANGKSATLYMIFQNEDLLPAVHVMIDKNKGLQTNVQLIGKVPHGELEKWYSAADFFVSASHKEGSGYALLEAMACGCIPIVTEISSFRKITNDGTAGFLYPVGDSDTLAKLLIKVSDINIQEHSNAVLKYFQHHLKFANIADAISNICTCLLMKKS